MKVIVVCKTVFVFFFVYRSGVEEHYTEMQSLLQELKDMEVAANRVKKPKKNNDSKKSINARDCALLDSYIIEIDSPQIENFPPSLSSTLSLPNQTHEKTISTPHQSLSSLSTPQSHTYIQPFISSMSRQPLSNSSTSSTHQNIHPSASSTPLSPSLL